MRYFDSVQLNKFLSKTNRQKQIYLRSNLLNAFKEKDSVIINEILRNLTFEQTGLKKHDYINYLSSFEKLLLKENDHVSYLEGIKTLKQCYANVKVRKSCLALVNAFVKRVKEVEGNKIGFALWLQDALDAGIISKDKFNKLTKNYSEELIK